MSSLIARRSFLLGLGSALAAPAIVRAGSLMPVKAIKYLSKEEIVNRAVFRTGLPQSAWRTYNMGVPYSESRIVLEPNEFLDDLEYLYA